MKGRRFLFLLRGGLGGPELRLLRLHPGLALVVRELGLFRVGEHYNTRMQNAGGRHSES